MTSTMLNSAVPAVTICTVACNNAGFIRHNIALTRTTSGQVPVRWVIAENSPADSKQRLEGPIEAALIIAGEPGQHTPAYQHSLALHQAIACCQTRFLLVLDADFYIVRQNWAMDMIRYMDHHELAMLGVPWHPKRSEHYRYFPAVHCTMFDTERMAKTKIDLRPDYPDGAQDPDWPSGYDIDRDYFTRTRWAKLIAQLPPFKARRRCYTDAGSRLYKQYMQNSRYRFRLIDAVYDASVHRRQLNWKERWLEKLLPDELCYIPKYYAHTSDKSFLAKFASGPISQEWDEFIWLNKPFGFHVHSSVNNQVEQMQDELDAVVSMLTTMTKYSI